MSKIILMTTTKPYDSYTENIQINAINSWIGLSMDKLILINSNDTLNQKYYNYDNVKILPLRRQSQSGVPYVKDMFESGYKYHEAGDIMCYINADIILQEDFCLTLKSIPIHSFKNYLISGRKWSWMNKPEFLKRQTMPLNIDEVKKFGVLDEPCAIDYFVHNKELYENVIPDDMLIARLNYDMWLNSAAFRRNATTIDITNTCLPIHPGHEYGEKKTLRNSYYDTLMGEVKINRKYESPTGTIDRYKYYTAWEDNKIVVKQR